MKMLLNNYENDLIFDGSYVNAIEILNKKAFYKMLSDVNQLNEQDNITFIFQNEIIDIHDKITILYDFINFDFNNKKLLNSIINLINENVTDIQREDINKCYKKVTNIYSKIISNFEVNIKINEEFCIQAITKLLKPCISLKNSLLDNLLLLIDIESEFKLSKLLVFVNLKDYLENNELVELYKYAIYKEINLLLIDNRQHITNKLEKKLLIDEDLIEFVL